MSQVEAISFDELQCGKKVQGSKKRFKWRFKIKGRSYLMELANSAVSGKRIVTLDSVQIYTQKNFFNINFDFMHKIEGHIFRITRTPDNINKFELRIDNRNFEDMLVNKTSWEDKEDATQSKYKKQEVNPFSEFGNFASVKTENKSNDFGDFDFDTFSKPAPKQGSQKEIQEKQISAKEVFDPFANYNKPVTSGPNPSGYETVNFQTNQFQTNNFGNFAQSFNRVEKSLNLLDEDSFATNTFNRNNLYNEFINQKPNESSENWSQFPSTQEKSGFGFEMTSKQVVNKVKRVAEEMKNKVIGNDDSLI